MAKQLIFTDPITNKTYTLEFNRTSVLKMEAQGFYIDEERLAHMPATTLLTLFHGAFMMHHRYVKQNEAADIMERLSKKGLVERLMEMYMEPARALIGDGTETEEDIDRGNLITWSTNN